MPGILALDQARVTGWAWSIPGQTPVWGARTLCKEGDDHAFAAERFDLFLFSLLEDKNPDFLAFEKHFTSRNHKTNQMLLGLRWHILFVARTRALRCGEFDTRSATKLLTGKGKFSGTTASERRINKKQETIDACWARGWQAATENEADALALLLLAEKQRYPRAAKERAMVFKAPTGQLFA